MLLSQFIGARVLFLCHPSIYLSGTLFLWCFLYAFVWIYCQTFASSASSWGRVLSGEWSFFRCQFVELVTVLYRLHEEWLCWTVSGFPLVLI